MADAKLLFHSKRLFAEGAILELKIWQTPVPVRGSSHSLKYSLFYGRDGKRLVGYDNEAGKGDHRHLGDRRALHLPVRGAVGGRLRGRRDETEEQA